jgi:hypothetical protein
MQLDHYKWYGVPICTHEHKTDTSIVLGMATNWQVSTLLKSTDQQGQKKHQTGGSIDMCSDDCGVVKCYSPLMDCWELNFWNCHCIGIA